jgi:hypothetical protein
MSWFVEFRAVDGRVTRSLGYFADLMAAQRFARENRAPGEIASFFDLRVAAPQVAPTRIAA